MRELLQVVRVLLDVHADPTLSNWWGKSALSYAEAISQKEPECEVAADILTMLRDKVHKLDVARRAAMLRGCCARFRAQLGVHVCEIIAMHELELLKLPRYPSLRILHL